MCMDNQANVGKDSMYSGKLGGNIGRGAANFTPTPSAPEPAQEVRRAIPVESVPPLLKRQSDVDTTTTSQELGTQDALPVESEPVSQTPPTKKEDPNLAKNSELLRMREEAAAEFDKKAEELKGSEQTNPALEYSKWLYSSDKDAKYPLLRGALLGTLIGPASTLVTEPLGRIAKFSGEKGLIKGFSDPSVVAQNIRRGQFDATLQTGSDKKRLSKSAGQMVDYKSGVTLTPVTTISPYGY
jgi:hypothetical protein